MSYERMLDRFIRSKAMKLANRKNTAEWAVAGLVLGVIVVVGLILI